MSKVRLAQFLQHLLSVLTLTGPKLWIPFLESLGIFSPSAFMTFCWEQNGRQKVVKARCSENAQAPEKMDPKFDVTTVFSAILLYSISIDY
jgi:hypothetical protein